MFACTSCFFNLLTVDEMLSQGKTSLFLSCPSLVSEPWFLLSQPSYNYVLKAEFDDAGFPTAERIICTINRNCLQSPFWASWLAWEGLRKDGDFGVGLSCAHSVTLKRAIGSSRSSRTQSKVEMVHQGIIIDYLGEIVFGGTEMFTESPQFLTLYCTCLWCSQLK